MKPLSFRWVACATLVFLLFTSFSSARNALPLKQDPSAADNTHYYWYTNGGTVYDGWYTLEDEEIRMENLYGADVDTSPSSTIVAAGYALKGYPHQIWASYFLYVHY